MLAERFAWPMSREEESRPHASARWGHAQHRSADRSAARGLAVPRAKPAAHRQAPTGGGWGRARRRGRLSALRRPTGGQKRRRPQPSGKRAAVAAARRRVPLSSSSVGSGSPQGWSPRTRRTTSHNRRGGSSPRRAAVQAAGARHRCGKTLAGETYAARCQGSRPLHRRSVAGGK
jgi:hypothetical protein